MHQNNGSVQLKQNLSNRQCIINNYMIFNELLYIKCEWHCNLLPKRWLNHSEHFINTMLFIAYC